jgi:hypothetical protein
MFILLFLFPRSISPFTRRHGDTIEAAVEFSADAVAKIWPFAVVGKFVTEFCFLFSRMYSSN